MIDFCNLLLFVFLKIFFPCNCFKRTRIPNLTVRFFFCTRKHYRLVHSNDVRFLHPSFISNLCLLAKTRGCIVGNKKSLVRLYGNELFPYRNKHFRSYQTTPGRDPTIKESSFGQRVKSILNFVSSQIAPEISWP